MFEKDSVVPEWATMMPGPALAASLSAVDRTQVNGHDLVLVLQAQARMVAHMQAELLATMVEIAQCPPGGADSPVERSVDPEAVEFAADEIRAALRLTRRTADSDLGLAWALCERLPRVWEALHAGDIDVRRARVIVNGVAHLPVETARRVVDEIISEASQLTTGHWPLGSAGCVSRWIPKTPGSALRKVCLSGESSPKPTRTGPPDYTGFRCHRIG